MVDAMKPAGACHPLDLVPGEPERDELAVRHRPVLCHGERSKLRSPPSRTKGRLRRLDIRVDLHGTRVTGRSLREALGSQRTSARNVRELRPDHPRRRISSIVP